MPDNNLKIFTKPTADWFSEAFGEPTKVQQEAWPAIAAGRSVLVSAPTGTGKTLSAFLIFIDRLSELAGKGDLKEELYLIYVSPLKSLAGDIRENLKRPLNGIAQWDGGAGAADIQVGIRTGDTPQRDRQRMVKHPPHILIITPESLYLMLTSRLGRMVLRTAKALIIDELHALIDTKRGAHLMLSAARLDRLCERPLQRIGLSATIEPLTLAAAYLSPEEAVIVAPAMKKQIRIEVTGTTPAKGRKKDPVWEELAREVYGRCLQCRSVIAFTEGRRYAEKLAYFVNQLGGQEFARVHHGSLSKEQRAEAEEDLRSGSLRLLCATSSMELGIDVGDIDQVLQVGCPRTISGTMQRLGRAGHNPGRVSVMYMYPRTAPETLYCAMTAQIARQGGVEYARPPKMCLDVLAQHLVSMAAVEDPVRHKEPGAAYSIDDVLEILARSYTFCEVNRQDVKDILEMLAGDYEHKREIPVRPRILYDRLHELVLADPYSRMLAVAAGGTIPDKGLYMAKTEDGVKVGELDEEFVYESRLGDRFLLGAFGWKIVGQDKDTVIVTQSSAQGARLPFWKGETKGRDLRTSRAFGRIMRRLAEAESRGRLTEELEGLGMDEAARENAGDFLKRQLKATKVLPDDRTILMEHFKDSTGSHQIMVHALFGRQVNAPLALLMQYAARTEGGCNVGCVDEEDGFLLYPYGQETMPEGLLFSIDPEKVRAILEAVLPVTPVFNMTFRYNAARSLMMGMRSHGRQPLWMQRLRSTEMLDSLVRENRHPLIRETRRECLEDQWDIEGVLEVLAAVRCGQIAVREIYLDVPSPMSLPVQWSVEAAEMYEYYPSTPGIQKAAYDELGQLEQIRPSEEALQKQQIRGKIPEDAQGLHSLLMMEGDLTAQDLRELFSGDKSEPQSRAAAEEMAGLSWLEELAGRDAVCYVEPGLWIAAEQKKEYEKALTQQDREAGLHVVRRMLYYRGAQTAEQIQERYLLEKHWLEELLRALCEQEAIVKDSGVYYHARLYDRARKDTIRSLREQAVTQPPQKYAALLAERALINAPPEEQLRETLELFCGYRIPAAVWETVLLPRRVRNYTEAMLDRVLAQGEYFWKLSGDGSLCFYQYEDIDREVFTGKTEILLTKEQQVVYQELTQRGASFLRALTGLPVEREVKDLLLELAEKGLVCADSFVPVRQWLNRDKIKKATVRQRVNTRVMALSAGRWDLVHPLKKQTREETLEQFFRENIILCRETFRKSLSARSVSEPEEALDWGKALELLRIWEYTGRVRRGYFIRGLSGAQFIRSQDYEGIMLALNLPQEQIIWLNGADPAQLWGKVLPHEEGGSFLNVPGTAVALWGGKPAAVLERKGKVLRILDQTDMETVIREFVRAFREKAIFPEQKRVVIREYPANLAEVLKMAGFGREMQDYVLYR